MNNVTLSLNMEIFSVLKRLQDLILIETSEFQDKY